MLQSHIRHQDIWKTILSHVGWRNPNPRSRTAVILLNRMNAWHTSHLKNESVQTNVFLPEEFLCHWAPNFCTLNVCNMAFTCQIQPICFIQFGAYQEVEVTNSFIFSNKSSCQSKFAMCFNHSNHLQQIYCLLLLCLPHVSAVKMN